MTRFALLVACLTVACSHTHGVGPVEDPAAKPAEARERAAEPATPDGDIRIASSPSSLLKAGAARAIQDRLATSGDFEGEPSGKLDGPTRNALARFQRAHDLPATGTPDDLTVRKLGLDPKDVFRAGRPEDHR